MSGISSVYVKMPGSSYYSTYTSGSQLTVEGEYSFYAKDKAGNTSAYYTITLDKTKPTGTLYAGTNTVKSGTYTNASYIKFVPSDSVSGVSATYVKKPGSASYVLKATTIGKRPSHLSGKDRICIAIRIQKPFLQTRSRSTKA